MLTGDNATTAQAIARRLGIADVQAEVMPQDKHRIVRELREKGEVVAMAGDGVNDAPALAAADVGIAMGTGTEVAMDSAGVTLVKGDLMGIARARALSRATMRNIRQNLFFAFVYNAAGVPLAAGVLYPAFGLLLYTHHGRRGHGSTPASGSSPTPYDCALKPSVVEVPPDWGGIGYKESHAREETQVRSGVPRWRGPDRARVEQENRLSRA